VFILTAHIFKFSSYRTKKKHSVSALRITPQFKKNRVPSANNSKLKTLQTKWRDF